MSTDKSDLPKVSKRATSTPPSPIRRLAPIAAKAKSEGKKVYHLNIGQPDIESPRSFFEGVALFHDRVLAYEASSGNDILRTAWCDYMDRTLGIKLAPKEMLITTGASEALIFGFMVCCDPGDEVIIFDPTYANYIGFAAIAGVKLIPVACTMDKNFAIPLREEIQKKITPRTRAILLCSPNNPTGTLYSKDELKMLLEICNDRGLFFLVDETYREFVYDDAKPCSVLHLEPDNKRIIVLDSLSKRFSLCGARIGCLITKNEDVMAMSSNIAQARLAAATIDQFAAAHMLSSMSVAFVQGVVKEYQERRNVLFSALKSIPGVEVHKPQGAFYMIARLPIDDAEKFAIFLLSEFSDKKETTFLAPAGGFYMENGRGLNKVRLAYVLKAQDLQRAVEIVAAGLKSFQGR